jgi:hypothetical protein
MRILLFFCLSLFTHLLSGQQLLEQLETISTDFTFTVTNRPFSVTNQRILKRANARSVDWDGSGGGYGYESYHLEFVTSDPGLITKERLNGFTYYFTFYDKDDKLLLRRGIHLEAIDSSSNIVGEVYFYSLDLINLPLSLLDITRKIDIVIR